MALVPLAMPVSKVGFGGGVLLAMIMQHKTAWALGLLSILLTMSAWFAFGDDALLANDVTSDLASSQVGAPHSNAVAKLEDVSLIVVEVRTADDSAILGECSIDASRSGWLAGVNEVRDLTVCERALALCGKVIDEQGQAISGAKVSLQRAVGDSSWRIDNAQVTSGGTGSFAVRGSCIDDGLQVRVSAPGFESIEPRSVRLGDRDLVFVLRGMGSLIAPILYGDHSGGDAMLVFVTEHASGKTTGYPLRSVVGAGRLKLNSLQPGRVSLRVLAAGEPRALFARDDIPVLAGAQSELDVIDLRGVLHRTRLRLVDEAGRAIEKAFGLIAPDWADTRPRPVIVSHSGTMDVCSLSEDPVVTISAPGRKTVVLRAPKDGQRVVMVKGIEVELELELEFGDGLKALPEGCSLQLALLRTDLVEGMPKGLHAYLGEGVALSRGSFGAQAAQWGELYRPGSVRVCVPEEGEYQVRVRMCRKWLQAQVVSDGPRVVSVGTVPPRIELKLTEEHLVFVMSAFR